MIEQMKPKLSFGQSEIQDGDVICFQVDLPEKEYVSFSYTPYLCSYLIIDRIHDLESQGLYSNPVNYYDFLQNRVLILFKPKFEDPDPEAEFSLVLSKKQNYDIVCQHPKRSMALLTRDFRWLSRQENICDTILSNYASRLLTLLLANLNWF